MRITPCCPAFPVTVASPSQTGPPLRQKEAKLSTCSSKASRRSPQGLSVLVLAVVVGGEGGDPVRTATSESLSEGLAARIAASGAAEC
jgi:hypothetical protein